MARTIFNAADLDLLLARIDRLAPDAPARWGSMTAPGMICHLSDSVRVSTGEISAASKGRALANPVMRWLMAYVVPFPKARAKTAPEMLTTRPSDWQADLADLRAQLRTAADRGPTAEWAPHPAFGAVSGKMYGVLIHKHFDHHLRQFGV